MDEILDKGDHKATAVCDLGVHMEKNVCIAFVSCWEGAKDFTGE